MIDDYSHPRDLSYGMTPDQLMLDPATLESIESIEVMAFLTVLVESEFQRYDPDSPFRALNMALALYERMVTDSQDAYEGLGRIDLFAAALDTAFIWEKG